MTIETDLRFYFKEYDVKYICKECNVMDKAESFEEIVRRKKLCLDCLKDKKKKKR